jgi:hypothetical protein
MTVPNTLQVKNRADLSQFLIHLTKNGTYQHLEPVNEFKVPGFREVDRTVVAKTSLEDMVKSLKIEARGAFGYFRLKINMYRSYPNRYENVFRNEDADPNWLKAVCFSETPLSELKSFYKAVIEQRNKIEKRNKYQKYGLAFRQENVRAAGGNPIFYVDSRRKDLRNMMDTTYKSNLQNLIPMMHLFEGFGPLFIKNAHGYSDFRWEREWRMMGDFNFKYEDVAFGICPENEIPNFWELSKRKIIFIDPDWDKPTLTTYLKSNAPELLNEL